MYLSDEEKFSNLFLICNLLKNYEYVPGITACIFCQTKKQ